MAVQGDKGMLHLVVVLMICVCVLDVRYKNFLHRKCVSVSLDVITGEMQ